MDARFAGSPVRCSQSLGLTSECPYFRYNGYNDVSFYGADDRFGNIREGIIIGDAACVYAVDSFWVG